jgi:hypothetical protein
MPNGMLIVVAQVLSPAYLDRCVLQGRREEKEIGRERKRRRESFVVAGSVDLNLVRRSI